MNEVIKDINQGFAVRLASVADKLNLNAELKESIAGWPSNPSIPVFKRDVAAYKSHFEADAAAEETWLISSGVSATEAFKSANNHLFRRVVAFVARVVTDEYTIYQNISTHFAPAIAKLEEFERLAFSQGPKPDFELVELFGEAQVSLTKIDIEHRHIQEGFMSAFEKTLNLHIPFDLITPFIT